MSPSVMRLASTLLAFSAFTAAAAPAAAQVVNTSPCAYATCAVRLTVGFTGERLVRGETSDEILKIDFRGGNAADFLGRVESAARPANDFRTRRLRAALLGAVSGAAMGYFVARSYRSGDAASDAYPTSADYAALFVGVGAGAWGGIEAIRSRNSLSRAIWEFNRAPVP